MRWKVLESKIVYKDGDKMRSVRGEIVSEDKDFIFLQRRTSEIRINKNVIQMIEKRKTPENFGIKGEKIPEELTDEDRKKYG